MPSDPPLPYDTPAYWLEFAQSDLASAAAGVGVDGVMPWKICYDSQQAAEKALKAVLVARGVPAPRTHNIGRLIGLLRQDGARVPESLDPAVHLTDYAGETRYPSPFLLSAADADRALARARAVLDWAQKEAARPLAKPGEPAPG